MQGEEVPSFARRWGSRLGRRGNEVKSEESFIAQDACDGAAVLSTQADHSAGAEWKEKASACIVRNDGVVDGSTGPFTAGVCVSGFRNNRLPPRLS